MVYMHDMHIAGMDLNLAVVLHALLEERSVSRAGRRLALSQSATSHALSRLRELLGDPLFVRTPRGLAPTARAEEMAEPLAVALRSIEGAFFAPEAFDAATAQRSFRIASSDYAEHVIMPSLLTRLAKVAPRMDLWGLPAPNEARGALAAGEIDLVVGPAAAVDTADALHESHLWDDDFVVVMRKGHPLTRGKLTVARYAAARHAFIAPRGRPGGVVDEALAKVGRSRRIAFTTPNFLVAPQVIAKTDLVITLASRIARAFTRSLPLVMLPPPLELPGFRVSMFWHERSDADPAHRFLRGELLRVARALASG